MEIRTIEVDCKTYKKMLKYTEKESEDQLSALTTGLLMQHHRIIMDSDCLVHTTKNADTRTGRVELCHKYYKEMLKLMPFFNKEQLNIISNAEDALKGVKLL